MSCGVALGIGFGRALGHTMHLLGRGLGSGLNLHQIGAHLITFSGAPCGASTAKITRLG